MQQQNISRKKIGTDNKAARTSNSNFFITLLYAVICAVIIRSFLFEPFHIPSGSMKPNLLIGDYIFVQKYYYGYSRYSFPFGLNLFPKRILQYRAPQRGDVVVFRLPSNPSINYIKRIVGLPGDKIRIKDGLVYVNDEPMSKEYTGIFKDNNSEVKEYKETIINNTKKKSYQVLDQIADAPQDNTGTYEVAANHYFVMGDNRDNSQDSRFLTVVGYIPQENIVGKASFVFFSASEPVWKIWLLPQSVRFDRIFKKIL